MLQLRPNCECCDKDLPSDAPDARICSFECTFCAACAEVKLRGVCPNCGGNLTPRPLRPAGELAANPASSVRIRGNKPCALPRLHVPVAAFSSFTPYRRRPIRFLRLDEFAGWAIKIYGITASLSAAGGVDPAVVEAAVSIARAHLTSPSPPIHAAGIDWAAVASHGVAVLIVHEGRDAIFAVLESWFGESMLRHAVWVAPLAAPARFETASAGGLNVCVWELAVLEHERRAWLRHVLTPDGRSDRAAYLADVLNAEV